MEKKLISTKELAEYLGISYGTARQWVSARRIPFYKLGRMVRFDVDVIRKWLEVSKVEEMTLKEWR